MTVRPDTTDQDPRLYRFLYLDVERVRALAAMVFGGVPEEAVTERTQQTTGGVRAEVGVPGLVQGSVGEDVLYLRSERETRALHRHLFRATLRRLEELRRIRDIDAPTEVPAGEFLRLSGEVVVRDYEAVVAALDTVGAAWKAILRVQHFGASSGPPGKGRSRASLSPKDLETDHAISRQLPPIRDAIETMFGPTVRLYCLVGEQMFVGALDRDKLQEPPEPGLDPTTMGGIWTVFCEAEFGPGRAVDISSGMSEMEAALEQLIVGLKGIASTLRPTNATTVRPIAVYREL